jgi:hypothetical protein
MEKFNIKKEFIESIMAYIFVYILTYLLWYKLFLYVNDIYYFIEFICGYISMAYITHKSKN